MVMNMFSIFISLKLRLNRRRRIHPIQKEQRERRIHFLRRDLKILVLEMQSNQREIFQDLLDGLNTSYCRDKRKSYYKD